MSGFISYSDGDWKEIQGSLGLFNEMDELRKEKFCSFDLLLLAV